MPVYVSGYFLSFANTRAIMSKLQIPDKGVGDERLEFPINDWLAKQGRKYPLARAIRNRDKEYAVKYGVNGMFFLTHFIVDSDFSDIDYEEGSLDKVVKDWLVNEGGIRGEDITWYSRWDEYNLTRFGFCPDVNDIQGPTPKIYRLTPDQSSRFMKSGKEYDAFLEEDLAGEHVETVT